MAPARGRPRPLPAIVGDLLARGGALLPAAVTAERLAGWRNDPDITAHLAGLVSLDLGGTDITGPASPYIGGESAWCAEDNLAHLLEHTPSLKTLNVHDPRDARIDAYKGIFSRPATFGLTPALPRSLATLRMLKVQMG